MLMQRLTPGSELRSELGKWFDRSLRSPWTFDPWGAFHDPAGVPIKMEEKPDGVVVHAELPGVDPADIDVRVSGDELTIAVETEETNGHDGTNGHAGEGHVHRLRSLHQTIRLPCKVDPETVVARSKHGILTLELTKPTESMPKRIPVKAS